MVLELRCGTYRANSFETARDVNKDFTYVKVVNAPDDFISFKTGEEKFGYLIDTSKFNERILFGNGTIEGNTVTFDVDDVFVYDKNGTIFYAKGYNDSGTIYYNATVIKSN